MLAIVLVVAAVVVVEVAVAVAVVVVVAVVLIVLLVVVVVLCCVVRLNVQKWSKHGVFYHFDFEMCFAPQRVCTFSTSQIPKVLRR